MQRRGMESRIEMSNYRIFMSDLPITKRPTLAYVVVEYR
jgi:hypothetical protein